MKRGEKWFLEKVRKFPTWKIFWDLENFEEKTENSSERVYVFLLYHNVRSGPYLPNSYQSVSINIEWTHFVSFTWQDIYEYDNRLIR